MAGIQISQADAGPVLHLLGPKGLFYKNRNVAVERLVVCFA